MTDPSTSDIPVIWQVIANVVGLGVAATAMWYGRLKGKDKAEPAEEVNQDFVIGGASLLDSRPIRREMAEQFRPVIELLGRMASATERSAGALEGVLQEMAERSEQAREDQRLEQAREEGRREERDKRTRRSTTRRAPRKLD